MLYNLVAEIANIALKLMPFKSPKLKEMVKGRKQLIEKIEATVNRNDLIAWFHCASLGEFEQGRELIKKFRIDYPNYKIVLTFFSPSGYNICKNNKDADYIFYIPIDTHRYTKRFVKAINPKIAIFIKYELWRNIIYQTKLSGAKIYLVSAIFTPKKPFFKWWGGMFRRVLRKFDHIFVQNEESKALLQTIGIENCSVSGDTRFDRVYSILQENKPISKIDKFCNGEKAFIAGSTWEKDDSIAVELIKDNPNLKFIIAPHELGEKKIVALQKKIQQVGAKVIRYTKDEPKGGEQVLILDTIGILSHTYKYGRFALIGGGFSAGIHNTLEAATFGLPLIFGPNNKQFKEAQELLKRGGAVEINSPEDAKQWLSTILSSAKTESQLSEICRMYVEQNKGACDMILSRISSDLKA